MVDWTPLNGGVIVDLSVYLRGLKMSIDTTNEVESLLSISPSDSRCVSKISEGVRVVSRGDRLTLAERGGALRWVVGGVNLSYQNCRNY